LLIVCLPFFLLAAVELGLRLAGYGYPTSFFLEQSGQGKTVLTDNPKFGWRFFPHQMARAPQPQMIASAKPAGTMRIVVFGESAALGDPEPAFGFSRMLEVLLDNAYPKTKFEVINTSMTAINSHAILPMARECARLQADYWIIYMGNNEVVGPYGSGTVFSQRAPSLGLIHAGLFLKTLRTGQLVDAARLALTQRDSDQPGWRGMEMFLQATVRADDPLMSVVYRNFQSNLGDIIAAGKHCGAQVLVCTVAANEKDCAPFASVHRPGWAAADEAKWGEPFKAGIALATEGNYQAAMEAFQRAQRLDPDYAELLFRMADCHWALGQYEQARTAYQGALDQDALRFRADSRINQIIAETARGRTSEGIHLVDARQRIAAASPQQVAGRELLWEHVHFNWEGNYVVALAVAEQLGRLLPPEAAAPPAGAHPWASSQEVARQLAYTDGSGYRIAKEISRRLQAAPFTGQADHQRQVDHVKNLLARWKPAAAAGERPRQMEVYRQALAARPGDWILAANFAEWLQAGGENADALAQWQRVAEMMPFYPQPYYCQGNLLYEMGQHETAMDFFRRTLALKPDCTEAYNGMALSCLATSQLDEALAYCQRALTCDKSDPDVRCNLGIILEKKGRTNEAIHAYEQGLAIQPDHEKSRLRLGNLLVRTGALRQAEKVFQDFVKVAPEHAAAHNNYGTVLARQGRHAEALAQFREAVQYNADYHEARFNLANSLAALNRLEEAIAELEKLLEQKPDWALARKRLEQFQQRKLGAGP
jgi:tetratricopeptide (TPR) repeat protein